MKLPELPSNIGKRGKWVHPPDDFVVHYRIADEVRVAQSNLPGSKIPSPGWPQDAGSKQSLLLGLTNQLSKVSQRHRRGILSPYPSTAHRCGRCRFRSTTLRTGS